MTDDKLNLVLASAMIRSLMRRAIDNEPRVVNDGRLELVERAAGLRVGVDGNCAFAVVGPNLQDGDSAFVQIEPSLGVQAAEAEAVAQLYETLIGKGPPPAARKMRDIANDLIEICAAHDRDDHGGKVCRDARITTAGYLAHCVGVCDIELPLLVGEVLELNSRCRSRPAGEPCRTDGDPRL